MKQYISKSALVAEIERRIEAHKETLKNCNSSISEMVLKGSMSAYQSLLHFLDPLETKDVDLEKELNEWRHNHFHGRRDDKGANGEYLTRVSQLEIAEYFYGLGLKVQKGE